MRFYVSKTHDRLNSKPFSPERISRYVCVNPYYKATLEKNSRCDFMIDSGAFQDVGCDSRLSFKEALERQLDFEKTVTVSGRPAEAIVSYDRLVDEQLGEKGQFKKRVSRKVSEGYVKETIDAAKFLSERREELRPRKLILSCQGVTAKQYVDCVEQVLEVAEPGDIIGFGGFCIISRSLDYERQFYNVINKAFPLISKKGIDRVHIFGVGIFRVLVQTDIFARMNGIECSYDTSSSEINAVFGRVFNPMAPGLNSVFSKEHKYRGYHPAELAMFNVQAITDFWDMHSKLPLPNEFKPGISPRKRIAKPSNKVVSICDYNLDGFSK